MDRRLLCAAYVAVVLSSTTAFAQFSIRTEPALQGYNPYNPAQVGHPVITGKEQTPNQLLGTFTVTNYSTKTVTEIEYGWKIAAPYTCIDSDLKPQWDHATVKVDLPPGKEMQIDADVKLSATGTSKELANQASLHKSPVVLITIGLLRVVYSDGTIWTDEEAIQRQVFDGGMHEKLTACKAKPVPQASGKCGKPDPLARLNVDQISEKGSGGGYSCISRNCNVAQLINFTCTWEVCEIYCCGYGCDDPCHGACEPYWLPWQCADQYY